MKTIKRKLINDVTAKINALPADKQNYVLGIMDGILISSNEKEKECAKAEDRGVVTK